jgi:plastocyanin
MQMSVLSIFEWSDGRERWRRLAVSVAGVAVVAVACGGGSTGGPAPGATTTATSGPASSPPSGQQVTVQMTDFRLALPETLTPGTYTFVAVNAGQTVHAIQIDGPGVSDQRTPGDVRPGQSASLTVTLQPGSYDIYCPVDGHRAMGMDTHFTVR